MRSVIQDLQRQAKSLIRNRRFEEARALYARICAKKSQNPEDWFMLGALNGQLGRLDEAVACCRRTIELDPDHGDAHYNLAQAFVHLNRHQDAVTHYQHVLRIVPNHIEALNHLGFALQEMGQHEQAIPLHRRALDLQPDYADAAVNLGTAHQVLGRLDEAGDIYRRVLSRYPGFAKAHFNLGIVTGLQGRLDEAEEHYRTALNTQGDYALAHWNLACLLLLRGRFEEGWTRYEWRWRCKEFPRRALAGAAWTGIPAPKSTVLIHAEQGFGDTIQFVRYTPLVKQRVARVIVECQPSLARLIATCAGVDQVVLQGEPLPPYDMHIPMLGLPHVFRTSLDTIPATVPYLRMVDGDHAGIRSAIGAAGNRYKVGLVWGGNPAHKNDRNRSCPVEHFIQLLQIPGLSLFSLQKGERAAELARPDLAGAVTDLSGLLDDFADTACAVSMLDLVITVDTAVAHLAGALGRPAWVLLPAFPDWRWLLEREDSPWYPTMRLFRQAQSGDWGELFGRVAVGLREASMASESRKP